MKHQEDTLISPPLGDLLEKIPKKFELVLAATRRAKQIIRQQRLNPMGVAETEKHRKPLSIALTDILEERVDQATIFEPDLELDALEEQEQDFFPDLPGVERESDDDSAVDLADFPVPPPEEHVTKEEDLGVDLSALNWEISEEDK